MEIRLRPELEAVVRQDVQSGAYETVDEYVEHAVAMLHEQEAWLAAHRAEIESKIGEGYAAAQRGELLGPEESRDSREAADRVEAAVFRACDLLSESPFAGRARKDLTALPLRFWVVHPYSNYLIVYEPERKPLQIIRIIHGARDLPSVLR